MNDKDVQQILAWIGTTLAGAGGVVGLYTKWLDYREKQRLAKETTLSDERKTAIEGKKQELDADDRLLARYEAMATRYEARIEILENQVRDERKRCDEELEKMRQYFNDILAKQNEKIRELVSEIARAKQ
jgi:hypothetical protein